MSIPFSYEYSRFIIYNSGVNITSMLEEKGYPYNMKLQQQLEVMKELLPSEYKQCQLIWGKAYVG